MYGIGGHGLAFGMHQSPKEFGENFGVGDMANNVQVLTGTKSEIE
jgi:hypothetical protein